MEPGSSLHKAMVCVLGRRRWRSTAQTAVVYFDLRTAVAEFAVEFLYPLYTCTAQI